MDINTWRGIATLIMLISFLGLCWWAYSGRRKKEFDEASQLPFLDDEANDGTNSEDRKH